MTLLYIFAVIVALLVVPIYTSTMLRIHMSSLFGAYFEAKYAILKDTPTEQKEKDNG